MKYERLFLSLSLITINLFGLALLYLGGIGKLSIYIHPSSQWFVLCAGITFIVLNIVSLFNKGLFTLERSSSLGVCCLLVVTLLILSVKPVPLSVETARTRISNGANPIGSKNAERFTSRKTSDFGIVDWLAAFANPEEAFRYENTPADISGFLLIQDGQLFVGRLVITCCGADAQPAVIQFNWTDGLPKENTWIRIRGTMRVVDTKPVLKTTSLEIIPEPKNPYAE